MPTLWDQRFANHPLWASVDRARDAVKDLDTPSDVDLADSLSRIQWVLGLFEAHRTSEDVRGYTATMLDSAQRTLEGNVLNQIQEYVADPDTYTANLRAAADQSDSVLDVLGTWPTLPSKGAAIAAGQAFSGYEKSVKTSVAQLRKQTKELTDQLSAMTTTVASEQQLLKQARETFESTSETEIEAKLDKVETHYLDRAGASVTAITDYEFKAKQVFEELEVMEHEGRGLLEAIANRAVAKDYRTNARNKSIGGWIWDGIGLLIGATSVTLLLVHLFDDDAKEVEVSLALTRLAVSIAGLGLAALCFRRGADNHKEARRSKRADIRLSTVEGFVANQDSEFRDALKEAMADRIYLQDILESADEYDEGLYDRALERLRKRRAPASDPEG